MRPYTLYGAHTRYKTLVWDGNSYGVPTDRNSIRNLGYGNTRPLSAIYAEKLFWYDKQTGYVELWDRLSLGLKLLTGPHG